MYLAALAGWVVLEQVESPRVHHANATLGGTLELEQVWA